MGTWVVTGANRGIGLEMCRQLKARGDDVVACCRKTSKELDGLGVTIIEGVDVSDPKAGEVVKKGLGDKKIDVLVNNAGILVPEALTVLDAEGLRRHFDVNAIGPLLLTQALLSKLGKGSKVGLVSSRAGSIGDKPSGGMYGYRMSKAALNMAGANLAKDLLPNGVAVVVLHPGFIRTEMTGGNGNDDPPVAAKGLIARLDELTLETTGRFMHANGQEIVW